MSRVGNTPILIPDGVTVEINAQHISVIGPKGQLQMDVDSKIDIKIQDTQVLVSRKGEDKQSFSSSKNSASLHGLTRSLINNMIIGVSEGWVKNLELVGVGFRAILAGEKVTLTVGYSHPVEVNAPEGIKFEVTDNTKIKVSGIDKYLVGQIAANIKKIRVPDAYKGKGIRYQGERIKKKPGKAGKVTTK